MISGVLFGGRSHCVRGVHSRTDYWRQQCHLEKDLEPKVVTGDDDDDDDEDATQGLTE